MKAYLISYIIIDQDDFSDPYQFINQDEITGEWKINRLCLDSVHHIENVDGEHIMFDMFVNIIDEKAK